jgi:hypothetical protein
MVGPALRRFGFVFLALFAARSVGAAPITFTGNVANDFDIPGVQIYQMPIDNTPAHIAQPEWMTQSGLVSGWNFHDIALYYDQATDVMYVGVNTWGVAGNVDGNGTPGDPDPRLTAEGGTDPANFGGDKAMAVGFAPLSGTFNASNPPEPVLVAGIPGDKSQAGTGLDGFTVAKYNPVGGASSPNYDLVTSFGQTLTSGMGNLAFNPSAAHPGFEFTIDNFSKLLGANPANGFVLYAQDGSVQSVITGKDYILEASTQAQTIPEPGTLLIWAALATGGGLSWTLRFRRSRRARP